jgi:hypothetical protein
MTFATGADPEEAAPQLTTEHEQAAEMVERERRRLALEEAVEEAEHSATEAIGLWMTAVRRMITSAPSIGDALLEARDREVSRDSG